LKKEFYGTGDVVWPSSFALARLLVHCPSFVNNKNVLELGCGLGLVSATICQHTQPSRVTITDMDSSVLNKAHQSCSLYLPSQNLNVSKQIMDWNDKSTWPHEEFDVLLATDVLYDTKSIQPFVNVLQYYLLMHNNNE